MKVTQTKLYFSVHILLFLLRELNNLYELIDLNLISILIMRLNREIK